MVIDYFINEECCEFFVNETKELDSENKILLSYVNINEEYHGAKICSLKDGKPIKEYYLLGNIGKSSGSEQEFVFSEDNEECVILSSEPPYLPLLDEEKLEENLDQLTNLIYYVDPRFVHYFTEKRIKDYIEEQESKGLEMSEKQVLENMKCWMIYSLEEILDYQTSYGVTFDEDEERNRRNFAKECADAYKIFAQRVHSYFASKEANKNIVDEFSKSCDAEIGE